ncbi:MAG: trypsin-like serine peptidase [Marmoricola sp.]
MSSIRIWCASVAGIALAVLGAALPAQASTRPFAPNGVLFYPSVAGLMPTLDLYHPCSASVVHSTGHNLVATAAHCLFGNGATIEFVPGFHDGKAPYGVWTVNRIYVESAWKSGQSPKADVAFLRIAPLHGRQIEDVVGAHALSTPLAGTRVTVSGFPLTSNTASVCTATLRLTQGYPTVACPAGGMVDGVSGGAWIQNGRLVGVVGGLQQGGCSPRIAYSTPFGTASRQLWLRAEAGGPGDSVRPGFFANSCR